METEYSSVGKNNVRKIAVDFSCEFKHLQSPEWAGQEPKKWHSMTSEKSKTSQGVWDGSALLLLTEWKDLFYEVFQYWVLVYFSLFI